MIINWKSNKKFFVAKKNVNFQNKKKIKKKSSKEISMRDHSENKKKPKKKMYTIMSFYQCSFPMYNFYNVYQRTIILQKTQQNQKKIFKNPSKNKKKTKSFTFHLFQIEKSIFIYFTFLKIKSKYLTSSFHLAKFLKVIL
jgi:hypothetical protein